MARQRYSSAERAARVEAISRLRSDRAQLSRRAARHPWSRPALRGDDPTARAEVTAWFAAALATVTEAHGPPSLSVRVALAQSADAREMAHCWPQAGPGLLREAERAQRYAERMAALEARAWRRREREARP